MREIKFRAWNGEQMVSPDYIARDGSAWWKENSVPTRSIKVMQFTGLHDKKGKEIYEGDILREIPNEGFDPNPPWAVEWYVDDIHCGWNTEPCDTWYSEIIGNIYENPELLNG